MESQNKKVGLKNVNGSDKLPNVPADGKAYVKPKEGRPCLYEETPEYFNENGYNLALLGFTIDQIADSLFIGRTTIKRWLRDFPEFRASVNAGKDIADGKVAASLYQRAVGFVAVQEKAFVDKDGGEHIIQINEYVAPDVGAAKQWLNNRRPNLWNDKVQLEHSGEIELTMDLGNGDVGGKDSKPAPDEAEEGKSWLDNTEG